MLRFLPILLVALLLAAAGCGDVSVSTDNSEQRCKEERQKATSCVFLALAVYTGCSRDSLNSTSASSFADSRFSCLTDLIVHAAVCNLLIPTECNEDQENPYY